MMYDVLLSRRGVQNSFEEKKPLMTAAILLALLHYL